MSLSLFHRLVALGFYFLTSGLLSAASHDTDNIQEYAQSFIPHASAFTQVPRPLVSDMMIPEIARGYEDIYRRFLEGKLIYTDPNSKARKELLIRDLTNPLEGTFDLSECGDTGAYLSIATGYRKAQKPENINKLEIWIAPRFLVEGEISTAAKHLQPIMGSWNAATAPVGLFWSWGGWGNKDYDYLVSESFEELGSANLYEKEMCSRGEGECCWDDEDARFVSCFIFEF